MPIKKPTRVAGGSFLDLRELCATGPVLALFRIVEFLPGEPDNYRRTTYPVMADVLICSGDRAGEVCLGEVFKYAPANALRGVKPDGSAPVNEPEDELPYIVSMIDKPGSQPFVGLDPAEGEALDVILDVYADGAGWGDAPAAAAPAAAAAPRAATPINTSKAAAPAATGDRPWRRAG